LHFVVRLGVKLALAVTAAALALLPFSLTLRQIALNSARAAILIFLALCPAGLLLYTLERAGRLV